MNNNLPKLEQICEKYNIALLYIYGSQVEAGIKLLEGKKVAITDPLTDVDIGIVFDKALPGPRERYILYSSIYNELSDLFTPFPLDLVFIQENHSVFQGEVICGKCLYYSNIDFKDNYEENILRRAADFKPFLEMYYDELLEEIESAH